MALSEAPQSLGSADIALQSRIALAIALERFSLDVSRDSYRGFPGARKSDSASSDGNGGAGDGEGILEGSAHTGSLDRGDRRERTRGGASARRQRLDCDPLDRSLDDDRQLYFHSNSVLHIEFERLTVGTEVRFTAEQGEDGPQASGVQVVGKPGD